MAEQVRRPHATRLSPAHPLYAEICQAHERAVLAGLSSYRDPASGYTAMTSAYLLDRGYCCNSHCRHCPYVE